MNVTALKATTCALALGLASAAGGRETAATALPLRDVAEVPLGGRATRLDYASIDPIRHLLFIAHLGDSAVIVVDMDRRRVVARISGIRHAHGVLAVPELGVVYASATGSGEVVAIDENTLTVTARAPGGVYPDGMAFAPTARKLYVSDERGGSETVIDVATNRRVATIALGGEVGNTQYDPVTGHVFANVQTTAELVEIDPRTDQVITRTRLPGARGTHGLLIDPAERRAYIACEGNHRLLVLDVDTRAVLFGGETGDDPDVLDYDPVQHRLYVAAESGQVSVFSTAGGPVRALATARLAPHAHVVAIDRASHEVLFPLENVSGRTVLRIMRPTTESER